MRFSEITEAKSEKAREIISNKFGEAILAKLADLPDAISKTFQKNLPGFIKWLEFVDPTRNSIYVDWMIKMFLKGEFRFAEDIGKLTDPLVRYEALKPKLPVEQRDINRFQAVNDFFSLMKQHEETDARSNAQKDREYEQKLLWDGEAIVMVDNDEVKIVIPKTVEAAQWFGRGTKWCTAAKSNNMFDAYNVDGPLYIIMFKGFDQKWQFHFPSDQFMDEEDMELEIGEVKEMAHYFIDDIEQFYKADHIQFISEPTERQQLQAVSIDPDAIQHITYPTERVQIEAVEENGETIRFIDNPSEKTQVAAIRSNGPEILQYISWPCDEAYLMAISQDPDVAINEYSNLSWDVIDKIEHYDLETLALNNPEWISCPRLAERIRNEVTLEDGENEADEEERLDEAMGATVVTLDDVMAYMETAPKDIGNSWMIRQKDQPNYQSRLKHAFHKARRALSDWAFEKSPLVRGMDRLPRGGKIGQHWSEDEAVAKQHGKIIFWARPKDEDVDWIASIARRMSWSEEKEVMLKPNIRLEVKVLAGDTPIGKGTLKT